MDNNTLIEPRQRAGPIYGYVPTLHVGIIFVVLFAISSIIHTAQAIARKQWFAFMTVILCGVFETLGWGGRVWSHYEPLAKTPYRIQTLCLVLGPTPLLAASFVIFGRTIRKLGSIYSRLTPRLYTIIFLSCDIASIAVQGAGGGIAASATSPDGLQKGSDIILAGIIFQTVVIIAFSALAIEYGYRYKTGKPRDKIDPLHKDYSGRGALTRELAIMLCALGWNTLFLFIRSIYRVVELSEGWGGPVMKMEGLFNGLDGAMVVLAIYTYNFVHPGWFLDVPPQAPPSSFHLIRLEENRAHVTVAPKAG